MKEYSAKVIGTRNYVRLMPRLFLNRLKEIVYKYFHIPIIIFGLYIFFKLLIS